MGVGLVAVVGHSLSFQPACSERSGVNATEALLTKQVGLSVSPDRNPLPLLSLRAASAPCET